MQMVGRSFDAAGSTAYRYGFNGKENDNEVKGEGNQQDYGMRIYDPRLGKFLSVDPLTKEYPELTPYQFASNRTIDGIDLDGLEYTTAGQNNGKAVDGVAVQLYPSHPAEILQNKANVASAAMQRQRPYVQRTYVQPSKGEPRTFQEKLEHERLRQSSYDKAGLDRDGNPKPGTKLMESKTFIRLNDNIVEPMITMATIAEGGIVGVNSLRTIAMQAEKIGITQAVKSETKYLYHYTSKEAAESISTQGLNVSKDGFSYLTNKSNLSPLQAQIELALPANRKMPNAILQIDVSGLRPVMVRRVTGNMPGYGAGGGTEFLYNQKIPADLIKILKKY
jgi:RHS repeat-associated protein